jgi:hypothetical protein
MVDSAGELAVCCGAISLARIVVTNPRPITLSKDFVLFASHQRGWLSKSVGESTQLRSGWHKVELISLLWNS